MAYTSGMMRYRVQFVKRTSATVGTFGRDSAGVTYEDAGTYWAGVTFSKGVKAMREGALDAYDTIMVRLRYTDAIARDNLLNYDGRWFDIESFHRDYHENEIQITARERANQNVTITNS